MQKSQPVVSVHFKKYFRGYETGHSSNKPFVLPEKKVVGGTKNVNFLKEVQCLYKMGTPALL